MHRGTRQAERPERRTHRISRAPRSVSGNGLATTEASSRGSVFSMEARAAKFGRAERWPGHPFRGDPISRLMKQALPRAGEWQPASSPAKRRW